MLRKHVRRPEPIARGHFHHIECSCGWRGKVAIHRRGHRLGVDDLRDSAEALWLSHVPPRERRVYLLLDTRPPSDFMALDDIKSQLTEAAIDGGARSDGLPIDLKALAQFKAQPQIVGNFLMPEGSRIHLIETVERDGMYYGRFKVAADGTVEELPVGEIREPNGRLWCAE